MLTDMGLARTLLLEEAPAGVHVLWHPAVSRAGGDSTKRLWVRGGLLGPRGSWCMKMLLGSPSVWGKYPGGGFCENYSRTGGTADWGVVACRM